jgi:hypothetical protein
MFGLNIEDKKQIGTTGYWIENGKVYIDAYHPAQTEITRKIYVDDIISIVELFKSND